MDNGWFQHPHKSKEMDNQPKTRQEKKGEKKRKDAPNVYSSKHIRNTERLLEKKKHTKPSNESSQSKTPPK